MGNETKKQLTPKEKFDVEMKRINKDINISNAPEKDAGYSDKDVVETEDQVEAAEKAMDDDLETQEHIEEEERNFNKHVGTKKIEVTKEQHINMRLEKQRKEILAKFNQVGGLQKEKLTPKQQEVIFTVLKMAEEEKLSDPVLKHLVEKKIEVATEYAKLNAEIKEVQLMIVERMAKLATACTESQATTKTYNRDILLYIQKNPNLIENN